MMEMSQRLNTNITNLGDTFLDTNGFIKEDLAGDFLYLRGKSWFTQVGLSKELASSFMHLPLFPDLGFAEVSIEANVDYLFDIPYKMSLSGLMIDADRNTCLVVPEAGEENKTKEFMVLTGYASSALEHFIWEQKYGPGGISAVKAIQIANESGIPVYDITSANQNIIDILSISDNAKEDMHNAINAGYVIKTPASNITYSGWTGIGYIVLNPTTGEGRYEISGGSGGTLVFMPSSAEEDHWAFVCVQGIYGLENGKTPGEIGWGLPIHRLNIGDMLNSMGYNVLILTPPIVSLTKEDEKNRALFYKILEMQFYEVFYFAGHGSPTYIGLVRYYPPHGLYRDTTVSDTEIYNHIPPEKSNKYKLVFLNSCQTAVKSGFANAFRIDLSQEVQKGVHRQAFIGAKDLIMPQFPPLYPFVGPVQYTDWGEDFFAYLKEGLTIREAIKRVCNGIPQRYYEPPYFDWFTPAEPYWDFSLP